MSMKMIELVDGRIVITTTRDNQEVALTFALSDARQIAESLEKMCDRAAGGPLTDERSLTLDVVPIRMESRGQSRITSGW